MKRKFLKLILVSIVFSQLTVTLALSQWLTTGNISTSGGNVFGFTDAASTTSILFQNKGANRMCIKPNGQIGIGTTSPAAKLHVNGTAAIGGSSNGLMVVGDNSALNIAFDNSDIQARSGSSGSPLWINFIGGNVQMGSSSLPVLYQASTGNFGVGTLTPGAKFHVSANETSVHGKAAAIEISNNNAIGGNWFLRAGAPGTATPARGFSIANDNGYYLVIDSFGQVAINTTTPANGYKLSVAGKVICEEVRVLLKASWPDYVFDNNYNLSSIAEVSHFIRQNHHLPGLPSACEVEEQGIDIAQMQSKIVEKMEQLTLYMIKQNEQISKLIKENDEIKKCLRNK